MRRSQPSSTLLFAVAVVAAFGLGAVSVVSATTDTTEPSEDAPVGTEPSETAATATEALGTAAPPAGGSAAPSADAAAFCDAAVTAINAAYSEDPEAIGPAFEALVAAAPDDIASTVEAVVDNAEAGPGDPVFDEAYTAMLEYMTANCGFAELEVAASEYAFGGIPEEVPAGPTMVTLVNIGEEVHEIIVGRVADDVTLTAEEILALPEDEQESIVTFVGATVVLPGSSAQLFADFTPGRHLALCFIPQGTTAEVFEQMMAAEGSIPAGSIAEGSVPVGGSAPSDGSTVAEGSVAPEGSMVHEGSTPAEGSAPAAGSVPPGEGPPHFTLGMIQEFTVV